MITRTIGYLEELDSMFSHNSRPLDGGRSDDSKKRQRDLRASGQVQSTDISTACNQKEFLDFSPINGVLSLTERWSEEVKGHQRREGMAHVPHHDADVKQNLPWTRASPNSIFRSAIIIVSGMSRSISASVFARSLRASQERKRRALSGSLHRIQ